MSFWSMVLMLKEKVGYCLRVMILFSKHSPILSLILIVWVKWLI